MFMLYLFNNQYPNIIYILYITGCHRCGPLFVKKTVHSTLIGRTDQSTSVLLDNGTPMTNLIKSCVKQTVLNQDKTKSSKMIKCVTCRKIVGLLI